MFVVSVTVHVKPECVKQFIEATFDNARNTRNEPGNVRFDVLQLEADVAQFLLYEVYLGPEGFVSHQETPHYLRWKEAVAPMMAEPRIGLKHQALFYGEEVLSDGKAG